MEIPSDVQDCVAFLGFDPKKADDPDPADIEVYGTAFFVIRDSQLRPSAGHVYLITAKHVIDDLAHRGYYHVFVRLNMAESAATWYGTKVSEWVLHPNDSLADVAVFPFTRRVFDHSDQRLFPIKDAATQEVLSAWAVGVGEELFFPGLFYRHYGRERNLPIVRTGTIAGMPSEKLRVRDGLIDAYLVEARSIGGLSGSPVFVRLDSRKASEHFTRRVITRPTPFYGLLGLIRGHYEEELALDSPRVEALNMGIGIVVPVEKIIETILHPELVEKYNEVELVLAAELPPEPTVE
ncbi:MAG TPA: hypothetical protein VHS78_18145 [Candidatus Elarobacter sp.]|jgi:hypothetical protein|nr:hypothetical protein [Candidatus Elarobacter sp.]